MKPSTRLINYIRWHEGLILMPMFDDYAGTPDVIEYSIGYGHQIQPNETYLYAGITKVKAEELLKSDVTKAGDYVEYYMKRGLNQKQYDALTNLVYAVGAGNASYIMKMINDREPKSKIKEAWKKFGTYWQGKQWPGLVKMRATEIDWFYSIDAVDIALYTAIAGGLLLLLTTPQNDRV